MIDYSVAARPNPREKDEAPKYYASAQSNKLVNLDEFAKHM